MSGLVEKQNSEKVLTESNADTKMDGDRNEKLGEEVKALKYKTLTRTATKSSFYM